VEKNNIISEKELNKILNLIESKHVALISEQNDELTATANKIQGDIRRATSGPMTNTNVLLAAIQKINTLQLYNSVNGFLKQTPIDGNSSIIAVLNDELGMGDAKTAEQIKQSLAKIGKDISFQANTYDVSPGSFKIVNTRTDATTVRQNNINSILCSVKDGIIINPSSKYNNTSWESWRATYNPLESELEVARKSCSTIKNKSGQSGQSGQSRQSGQSLNNRFTKSVSNLGVQNGKMDVQTLQKILATLEGGTTQPKNASDFAPQGVPQDAFNQQAPPTDNELA
jgi:hypothetical protein